MNELFQHAFFRHAVMACILGGGGLSLIGVFVTLMDIPFLGISMSHSAFLGAIIGLLCGFDPLIGAIVACGFSGLLVGPLSDRAGASSNSILAVIFSATMGLAFLLLARIPGPKSEALNLIWGSILTISGREILILGCIFAITVILLIVFFKEISVVLFNREIAAACGIPEKLFYYGVILIAGLLISASLNIVGGLLIFSLLVNPPGAAYQLTYRLKTMFLLSALFGIASCFAGLYVSYCFDVPTGAVIVLCSSGIYALAFMLSPKRYGRITCTKYEQPAIHQERRTDRMINEHRKEFFNRYADQWLDMWYKDNETGTYTRFDTEFERLFKLVPIAKGDHVLDLGCGSGVLVPHILERLGSTGRLYEVDYAEKMIAANQRLHTDKRITFLVSDVLHLEMEPASCDLVICFACFPHLDHKDEALKIMSGALKKGGHLAIAHFLSSQEINDHHRKAPAVMHDTMPEKQEMNRLFTEANLIVESSADHAGFYLMLGRKL